MAPCSAEGWGTEQKSGILQDWTQVGTYQWLQDINRNVKLIFKLEGKALGTQYEVEKQGKSHALVTTQLVSPGFFYSSWRDSGNSRGPPNVPTLNFSSIFWDTWRDQSCQRDHISSWTRIRSNPWNPADLWLHHSPVQLECLTFLLGSSCNSLSSRITPGSDPAVLDLHLQHTLHKRIRKLFLFLCSMVFCIKPVGMQVVWFWMSGMKRGHEPIPIFNDLLIPVLIYSAVTA